MRRSLLIVQLPAAFIVLYLDLLAAAAVRWRPRTKPVAPRHRFALLIPAHDEELLLPRLLESLAALEYPRSHYEVHVVADNCADRTASIARASGAITHERQNDQQRGKGYALRWLLDDIARQGLAFDAYVVIDADSVASANLLSVLNAHMLDGAEAIQCHYGVLNRDDSWSSTIRYIALALYNGLRPQGREVLGLSSGLRGNGMCFTAPLIARFGWDAFTLAEDAEFHLRLVAAGVRVAYAPQATVLAEMPTSLHQARSQNLRWERGRLQLLGSFGPSMLFHAIAQRDPRRLDAVAEQLVPPLSVLTGLTTLTYAVTVLCRASAARRLAGSILLGQLGYVLTGLWIERAPARVYRSLAMAPLYVGWKMWVYVAAAGRLRDGRWVRTQRQATKAEQ